MAIRKAYRAGLAGLAALGLLAAGYGTASGVPVAGAAGSPGGPVADVQHQRDASAVDDDYEARLRLSDGRTVHVRLVQGAGVQERHRAAGGGEWSRWRTLHRTGTDLCQGVGLAERAGTVTLTADFGLYCFDGEPPTESVAGVATGDLTDWDVKITKDFDGWADTSVNDDGSKAVFLYDSDGPLYTLRWDRDKGFGDVVERDRAERD